MGTTIINVINSKGGVAKTTSSYNIACIMALKGKKVLMCDLDSQASLTISSGYSPLDFTTTIVDVFNDANKIAEAIYDTDIAGLSLLPSHPYLSATELNLINARSREKKLEKAFKLIDGVFDYIILDCPPQLSMVNINGLTASKYVVIPCETSYLSLVAVEQLIDTIAGVKEDLNENLEILGVIGTLYNKTKIDNEVMATLQSTYNVLGCIKRMTAVRRGFTKGLPIAITDSKSPVAVEYSNITDKIIEKVEGK